MNFKRKLPVPKELKAEYPITEEMGEIVKKRDKAVRLRDRKSVV